MHGHEIGIIRVIGRHPLNKCSALRQVVRQPRGVDVEWHGGLVSIVRLLEELFQKGRHYAFPTLPCAIIHGIGRVWVGVCLHHPRGDLPESRVGFVGSTGVPRNPSAILRNTKIHGVGPQTLAAIGGSKHGVVLVDGGVVEEPPVDEGLAVGGVVEEVRSTEANHVRGGQRAVVDQPLALVDDFLGSGSQAAGEAGGHAHVGPGVGGDFVACLPCRCCVRADGTIVHGEESKGDVASVGVFEACSGLVDEAHGFRAGGVVVGEEHELGHLGDGEGGVPGGTVAIGG